MKVSFLNEKKLNKLIRISFLIFIILSILSSSTLSLALQNNNFIKKEQIFDENKMNINFNIEQQNVNVPKKSVKESYSVRARMYGYKAYPQSEKLVWFYTDEPGNLYEIGDPISSDYLSGSTFGCDCVWYATEYGSSVLYGIDYKTGDMWEIGTGTTPMLAIAYDPWYNRMYGSSDNNFLYEISPDTGEQEMIGSFGSGVSSMVGLFFDIYAVLYGWDLGNNKLWTIDTDTGEATEIAPIDINVTCCDSGGFLRYEDILYLISNGHLYTCNKYNGECTLVGDFEEGVEITSCMFTNFWFVEHDVGVKSIDYPETGYAIPEIPMQVTIKNMGNKTEVTDVNLIVEKFDGGTILLEENFSGSFPPAGWKTDFWNKSDTNFAGGTNPEAQVYKNDQYNEGNYYDNYIMCPPLNCINFTKIDVKFNWGADYEYPQYSTVYVKFRSNSSCPWKDVTPWDNPVGHDQNGKIYEISCLDLEESFGNKFQVKWEYIGYYFYYNYLWLDDIVMTAYTSKLDYNETVKDVEIVKGEEKIVEFPEWTSSIWQDSEYENSWQKYIVNACTLLEDDRPNNNCKLKIVDLFYPYMHDVEIKSIDSPSGDGESTPAQTLPVQATIKNVGQNSECCIPITIRIGEQESNETLLEEYTWPNPYPKVPADGWTDEHKNIAYYYGWRRSYSSYAGGSRYEVYIPYYYCRQEYYFYSYAIDTSEYSRLRFRFKSYINHYSGQGLYTLEAGYSTDCETWIAAWSEEPSSSGGYEVDVPINISSENMYIGFWIKGDQYYFNYWYIDNVELTSVNLIQEYSDYACQGPDLEPGKEAIFTFEDWTPEFLLEEKSGTKEYFIEAEIECEVDKNPGNDIKSEFFTLEFWHDVGIDEITSPTGGYRNRLDDLIYDNGEPDGVNGLFFGYYQGFENWLIDDFEITQQAQITGVKFHFVWDPGYTSNMESVYVIMVEDLDECDPDTGPYYVELQTYEFEEYTTGQYYFSRPEVVVEAEFDGITLQPGHYYIGVMPDGIIDAYGYWLTAPLQNCVHCWYSTYFGYAKWTPGSDLGYNNDLAWAIYAHLGTSPRVWIQPGTEDINATVMNYGTFPKYDLTCYAEIWEYITNPNGNQVYTNEINDIDLPYPLGGYEELDFEDYTFADEGRYRLFLNLPASPDDVNKNNNLSLRIHVDDTKPESDYPPILDPPEPNGCNGWYVDDVEVILNATDPWSNDVSSGVKEIRYTINGGAEQIIPGKMGSFMLTTDGEDILVEYWAVDWVGNVEEQKNSFKLDIDQTVPDISLSYDVIGGNNITGWKFKFTAIASDYMSGMDRVEFYFNNELQETIEGPGPTYEWTYTDYGGLSVIINAIAYDKAGNNQSDKIYDPKISSQNNDRSNQNHIFYNHVLKIPTAR